MAKQTISYKPQVLDLTLYAGDGVKFRLVVTDEANAPVNLTGTMLAQIRKTRDSTDPPDAVFDIDLDQATAGIAVLQMTGNQTQSLCEPDLIEYEGVWDLQWVATDAEPITMCQGKVECLPDVSH